MTIKRNDVDTEAEFRAAYIDKAEGRTVLEVDGDEQTWVHISDAAGRSLWLDVRQIGIGGDGQHLCIDVHTFVDDKPAATAAMGITGGNRVTFPETGYKSHGWPAVGMPILMLGAQS